MKILHVIPSIGASLGGPSQVAMNLVSALRELGIDAEIATTNYDHPQPLNVPLNQRVEYPIEGGSIPVWFFPYNPPALKEFIFSRAFTNWCWQNFSQYDLIDNHYLFSYTPTCAATVARFKNIPYTVRTMGQLTPWSLAQGSLKKQAYSFLLERRNLNRAAAIHCTSTDEVLDVQRFGTKTPTVTLPLGVKQPEWIADADQKVRQVYNISADTPLILFLSRIHYKKRPDLLIQTMGQLLTQRQNCHLILAGSGEPEYLAELKHLAQCQGIFDRISFTGFVSGYDKNLLLQGSDLFVLPSYSENFGIAVAEALAAGLPVMITPDVQIAPEIQAAKAGLILEADVEKWTAAITQLLNNSSQRYQFRENGKQLAKNRYAWTSIAQELASVYTAIINNKNLPIEVRNGRL
jgi:glycosyltransferase involved in cell wall biosynthesis